MVDGINLQSVPLSQLYTGAELGPSSQINTRTAKLKKTDISADVAVAGKHTFQVATNATPELQLDQLEAPNKPMPLKETTKKHDTDIKQDALIDGQRPIADHAAFRKLSQKLGPNGDLIMRTLAKTHVMQARFRDSKEALSTSEIQRLKETAVELNRELEQGMVTPGTLLTEANAKQFKLTSLGDMTELLRNANNKANEMLGRMGFQNIADDLNQKLNDIIATKEGDLYRALKQNTHIEHPTRQILNSNLLRPTNGRDDFNPTGFQSIVSQANGFEIFGNMETITNLADDIFRLRKHQFNLNVATQNLQDARSQVLGLQDGKDFNIQTNPKLDDKGNSDLALKDASDNIKRLQKLAKHPDRKLKAAHEKAMDAFFQEVNQTRQAAGIKNEGGIHEDPKIILQQFQNSLEFHAETIRTASQQLQFAQFQPARQELFQKQLDTITKFRNLGGVQTISGSLGLGISGKAFGAPAGANLTLTYSYSLDCSYPEGAITAAHVKGITVGLKVGDKKVCSLGVSASKLFTDAKIFATPEAFVEHNTNNMLSAILLKRSFLFQSHRNRQADKQQWIAMTNNNLLLNRLNLTGAVQTGDKLSTGDLKSTKSIYTEMKTRTSMLKADINAAGGIFSNSASISRAKSKMSINSTIFDTLKKDPRLYAKQKDSYYFNQTTRKDSERSPLDQLKFQEAELRQAIQERNMKKVAELNQTFFNALEDLNTEFKTYANVVNAYELETQGTPDIDKKIRHFFHIQDHDSVEGKLLDIKLSYDKSRGARNRGEYLRAMMFTHARLDDIYQQTVEGLKELTAEQPGHDQAIATKQLEQQQTAINTFRNDYDNPPMRMNHKRHVQKFMTIKKTSKIITRSMDDTIKVGFKGMPKVEIKLSDKKVTQHHMRSQQVNTNTVEFALNSGTLSHFSGIMAAVAGHCHSETLPTATIRATLHDFIKNNAGKLLPNGMTLGKSSSFRVQLNFITGPDDKVHLNYCNLLSTGGTNLGGQVSAVNASLGTSRTNTLAQFIGHKSLNYPFSRYFFTKQPNGEPAAGWRDFLDTNIKNVRKLFHNAMTPGTLAYRELQGYNDDGEVPDCQNKINAFRDKYLVAKATPNGEEIKDIKAMTDSEIKDAFTDLMKLIVGFEGQTTLKRLEAQNN